MVDYLCGLTHEQWKVVHRHPPAGSRPMPPKGYVRAGLYTGRDHNWIIQYTGKREGYRYWNFANVFTIATNGREYDEKIEVAFRAREEAARLRDQAETLVQRAELLDQIAQGAFNEALVGDDRLNG